ncbi:unnamed protein product [Urochloa decumbens]|uniref:Uncharacterized protein n=1 Tax=Urochloa decumbens TaxID=240449 RepID=A0ABC9FH19_9POAL
MAIHRAAAAVAFAFRHISRRHCLSTASASAAACPSLLGYFHQPEPTKSLADAVSDSRSPGPYKPLPIRFLPLTPSSPRLSLGFLPADAADASGFDLFDSHLYWHVRGDDRALVLDPATMKFSLVRPPAALIWELAHYRFGEMPDDGRLCVAALAEQKLRLCVRGTGSADGWVLERETCLRKVFDSVPALPRDPLSREFIIFLGGLDAGRTGRVFIRTFGYGCFSYNLDTGKLDRLTTDDGLEYG